MSQDYASKQPQGFKNQITNVAIVGAGGSVGKYIVEELLKTGKHKVTAITRADSTNNLASGIAVAKVDYSDTSSLASALQGQDALIITMGVMAPPDTQSKLISAAATANVPWIFPNEWGFDSSNDSLTADIPHTGGKHLLYKQIQDLGVSQYIGLICSFWYEFSLGGSPDRYGFDFANRTVTFFDDGNTKINTSTWPQCGRAVASLLSLPVLPKDHTDRSTTLSQFGNRIVYISSFLVSQKQMLDSVLRVTGTKVEDWKVNYEGSKERYQAAAQAWGKGDRTGYARMMYSRLFYQDGSGNYEESKGLDNGLLGLPKEDLDEYTRLAVEYSKKGDQY